MPQTASSPRIDWVDYAKGICIVLVVMMHSTLGVEKAAGELSALNGFIEWARPFRMPDFFMISGLFLASRIDNPWRSYGDSKVLHFVYFYLLWMTIQFATKSWGIYQTEGLAGVAQAFGLAFIEPFGTLWFIYMLAVFFVVAKATRGAPPLLIFAVGALLEMSHVATGWLLIDEFAARFVYFYAGFWLAPHIFALAAGVGRRDAGVILAGLFVWGFANYFIVAHGWSRFPGISLVMGFVGAGAVVSAGVALSKTRLAEPLRYCGENSIVIYLAFFLFMAASRSVLLASPLAGNLAAVSLLVTAAGVVGPVLLFWSVRHTRAAFLFTRPQWLRLSSRGAGWHSAPHGEIACSQAR
ncbi:MAG: acyltransferase family protein [Rhizobiales bacterium]|nr:acyltransferase family protein [Hyphomicrobiales bacterium]